MSCRLSFALSPNWDKETHGTKVWSKMSSRVHKWPPKHVYNVQTRSDPKAVFQMSNPYIARLGLDPVR